MWACVVPRVAVRPSWPCPIPCGRNLLHLRQRGFGLGEPEGHVHGTVEVDGVTTTSLPDDGLANIRREKIGFIFQSFQLIHTLTVFENVELPLLLAGKRNARETAREKLSWVEMDELGARYPHQLSGGQMQRVAIARALVQSPAILLADEPTGNLDTSTGNLILDLLQRLTRQQNTATIMATHSVEAAALADVVVKLRDGQIAEVIRR